MNVPSTDIVTKDDHNDQLPFNLERTSMNDWWQSAAIYQIYPRSFMDSNNDGSGDLPGIIEKLDHVTGLGVDAIWISPFFKSPMKDYGYDVSGYCEVDPVFGTLDDFDCLVEAAHERGVRVLIDQVLSHTSDQHPWFTESRQSRDNPKADWYVWADAREDGCAPNNWLSVFGGISWEWDPRRSQYYLHNFLISQPDLNLHHPQVRQASLGNLEFWLKRGVDGFRLDAINFCTHDVELRDNPGRGETMRLFLAADGLVMPYGLQRHVYDNSRPETLEFLEEIRALLDRYDAVALGEVGGDRPAELMGDYIRGERRLHTAYNFSLMGPDKSAKHIGNTVREFQETTDGGYPCMALGNHDVTRLASRWVEGDPEPESVKLHMAMLACLRGPFCVYQGDELGLPEAALERHQLRDPYGVNFWPKFKGRDGCRTPMPWQRDAANAGFSNAQPWLPIDARHYELAADQQVAVSGSIYESLREFLAWRKRQTAILEGVIDILEGFGEVLAFTRSCPSQSLLFYFNLGAAPAATPLAIDWRGAEPLSLGDAIGLQQGRIQGDALVFAPRSMLILEKLADCCPAAHSQFRLD